jgi:ribonuclease HI
VVGSRAVPWQTRLFRGERVWIKVDPRGNPAAGPDGRVEMLYKPGGKVYRASSRNLEVDPKMEVLADSQAVPPAEKPQTPDGAVIVYTDGACTGNPGPMGIGVVIIDGKERQEISEYLGEGTNNIAELTAIVRALEVCPPERPVVLHSDSAYALGLLGKNWKAKANQALVEKMRTLGKKFKDLRLVKVAGHAGIPENERCDVLAREAVVRGK